MAELESSTALAAKESVIVREIKKVFIPNQIVSNTTKRALWIFWILVGFLSWVYLTPVMIPRPMDIIYALHNLWFEKGLAEHLYNTFSTQMLAMGIAIVLSLALAYSSRFPIMRPPVLFISTLRFISPGVLVVFLLLTFRPEGETLKLILFVFAMTVWYLTSMTQEVDEVKTSEYRHAYTLRMSELTTLKEVVIYGRLHAAWEMLRQNTAMMWAMIPMVEALVRSGGGLGMLYANENKHLKLDEMLALIIIMFTYGLLMDILFKITHKRFFPFATIKVGGSK